METLVDELAHNAGKDPVEYRRMLLKGKDRNLGVLNTVAEKAGWGKPLPAGHYQGIAIQECFGSIIGQVCEVSIAQNGTVGLHKVTCVVDCGWIVNPDTIKAQMEGGILYGITAALHGEITIKNGRVQQNHFGDYPPIRMPDSGHVDVYIMPSTEAPGGIGEPRTAVAAGSIVNAVAAATGKRIYKLPIRPDMLRGGTNTAQL